MVERLLIPKRSLQAAEASLLTIDLGRYATTTDEVYNQLVSNPVFSESSSREDLWHEWQKATQILQEVIPVIGVWLGGSFITSKLDPSDIDCVYWLDHDDVAQAKLSGEYAQMVLDTFSGDSKLKNRTQNKLRVDSYTANWRSVPEPKMHGFNPIDEERYYFFRGYWDDFWQRERITPKGGTPVRADTILRRGYLEVILNGFRA